jgi:signal transduction histidine kinase
MAYWDQQCSLILRRKRDMDSLRKRFGGLYWRLTGSYFAVTLLAAVIIEVAITLPTSIQGYQQGNVQVTPSGFSPPSSPTPSGFSQFLSIFWDHMQAGGLSFILIASVIGTLTGLLIMRNVTRRLRRITQAAEAWSTGAFVVEVRDRSRDELGQLARDLDGMAEQLRALFTARQELATVEERQRLARELHDSVKQDVFATALLLGATRAVLPADRLQEHAYLTEAEELAERARHELTVLIHELRPVALESKGLATALRDHASSWSRRTGIGVDVRLALERPAPPDAEVALFRVAQEALANVARHSKADHVDIELSCDDEVARLRVWDNGTGFDVARAEAVGVGLASMRERVEAQRGTLVVSGRAGAVGVEAQIPLAPSAVDEEVARWATPSPS